MFKKKTSKAKNETDLSIVIVILLMIVGWYTLMFPTSANLLNKIYNQNAILSYNNTMVSYSDEDIETMLADVDTYNESIYAEQQKKTFHYRGPSATDSTYKSVPNKSNDIGTLRIPSLDINVAIGHGTSDTVLQSEAGHLYGTSIPSDKESTHAVIAAHSALSTAKLFTDLNKMKEGDVFYVTVLNQEYEYTVDQIVTVLPEDDYEYEQVIEGKTYVTLYTCTPYGVNTHRLLIRGELTGVKTVDTTDGNSSLLAYLPIIKNSALLALIILAPFILALLYGAMLRRKDTHSSDTRSSDKKKEKGKGEKEHENVTEIERKTEKDE